ncbi:hypothetical protein SFRURICE_013623 [Spodoptera frugiperda]|nr:hypothetical protein SFRURICE_013623 [Spodoptera frugiperda]
MDACTIVNSNDKIIKPLGCKSNYCTDQVSKFTVALYNHHFRSASRIKRIAYLDYQQGNNDKNVASNYFRVTRFDNLGFGAISLAAAAPPGCTTLCSGRPGARAARSGGTKGGNLIKILHGRNLMPRPLPIEDINITFLVQHWFTPNLSRAAIKTLCRVLVKNSEIVIPEPLNPVLPNQMLSRRATSWSLKRIGLGFSVARPILWHRFMSGTFKSTFKRSFATWTTTCAVTSSLASGTPCKSRILRLPRVSLASMLCARKFTCC